MVTMSAVIPTIVPGVSASVVPTVIPIAPVSWRAPVTTRPGPMVTAPSPVTTHPDISRCRTCGHDLHEGSRHRLDHERGRSSYHRYRSGHHWRGNWDAKVDSKVNPGVGRANSKSSQSQNCNCLFHSFYRIGRT